MSPDLINITTFVVMAGALYFILIRPQMQRQKAHAEMLKTLEPGDRVVTAGGVIGDLVRVDDAEVVVEIAKGVEVLLAKEAVSRKVEE